MTRPVAHASGSDSSCVACRRADYCLRGATLICVVGAAIFWVFLVPDLKRPNFLGGADAVIYGGPVCALGFLVALGTLVPSISHRHGSRASKALGVVGLCLTLTAPVAYALTPRTEFPIEGVRVLLEVMADSC